MDKLAEHAIEKRQQRIPVDQASKTGSDDIKRKATNREERYACKNQGAWES
jgi:hypothetical protein